MDTTPSMDLIVPAVGEIVNLEDAPECARALNAIRDLERQLRQAKSALIDAIVAASKHEGTKTLHFAGGKAVVKGGVRVEYDHTEIETGLREAGMPEERIREIVQETVIFKVSAVEAKRAAAANPLYAAVIDAHSRKVEESPDVTVKITSAS